MGQKHTLARKGPDRSRKRVLAVDTAEESSGSRSRPRSAEADSTEPGATLLQDITVPTEEYPREKQSVFGNLTQRGYQGNESLILVGFFGVGKRTLGLIASAALHRELVNFDTLFEQKYGLSPGAYITEHGTQAYRALEYEITFNTLKTKRTGCVLVGFFKLPSSREFKLLKEWSKTNPVIRVQRDTSNLPSPWQGQGGKFGHAYNICHTLYGRCANFDFYNITQPRDEETKAPLKLKQTERDFTRFLRCIFGHDQQLVHSADPLSASYTYALEVPLGWLEGPGPDFKQLDAGTDAVSLVLNDEDVACTSSLPFRVSKQISVLRRHTRVPIIIDFEVTASPQDQRYWELLEIGLQQAPDMITVSLDIQEDAATALATAKGNSKIIGTTNTAEAWTESWKANSRVYLDKTKMLGCHALRVTSASRSSMDNIISLKTVYEANISSEIPVIGYHTGTLGRTSICLSPMLSPVSLSSLNRSGITLQQAQRSLYASFIAREKHFTIVGRNVAHSLSPVMHDAAYEACGMPHVYTSMPVSSFASVRQLLEQQDQDGIAVSLPYKTNILPVLDTMTADARHIGAVNTVVIERHSDTSPPHLTGYNTDYIGIQNCIERNLSPANSVKPETSALIIGAGGMARAAVYACHKASVRNICIFNRTPRNAHSLVEHYNQLSMPDSDTTLLSVLPTLDTPWPSNLNQPTVVVSCIPADGIEPNKPIDFDIPEHWLRSRTGGTFIEVL